MVILFTGLMLVAGVSLFQELADPGLIPLLGVSKVRGGRPGPLNLVDNTLAPHSHLAIQQFSLSYPQRIGVWLSSIIIGKRYFRLLLDNTS